MATLVLGFIRFDGPAGGYWDTYITAPAMFMSGTPVDFRNADGTPTHTITLEGVLPDDLIDRDTYGIITKDQRVGGGIVAAPMVAIFGQIGFRILFALGFALILPLSVLVWRRLELGTDWAGLAGGVMLAWNPFVLSIDRLNANMFALPVMLAVLYMLLERPRRLRSLVLLGVLFGVLAGIRNEAICFVPAIVYWFLRSDEHSTFTTRFRHLTVVGVLTVLVLVPVFYWKWYAFGHPLMHPSQYPHFQGFRPEFYHQLFGGGFCFNGLFNWPLHDTFVRTPHFGYPTYLLFPLVTIRAMGVVGVAILLVGMGRLWRLHRAVFWLLLLWMVPIYVLFGPQENWEEVKMTFMLLAYPPLGLAFAVGIHGICRRAHWRRSLVSVAVVSLVLFAGVRSVGNLDVPADERWYQRFPNASPDNPSSQPGLAAVDRNDHVYFESHESVEEIVRERAKLTAGWPWPMSYLPNRLQFEHAQDLIGKEWDSRTLEVEEVWDHIYRQLPTNQMRDPRCPARVDPNAQEEEN